PAFLAHHNYQIGELDPLWNVFDYYDNDTKLIHYTNLYTQPWKYTNHPYGELWFQYFNEARECGYITQNDIDLSLVRSYVRRDLLEGNFSPMAREIASLKRTINSVKKSCF
ncbi:MAG: glycosyl transferase, partial [Moorea sp. SIO4A1]|nr:glycosyl transferase [Moorena sp. SIO4A1]